MQFFPKICNFSQKYAIFLKNMQFFFKKYALENALNFRIHIKKMQYLLPIARLFLISTYNYWELTATKYLFACYGK